MQGTFPYKAWPSRMRFRHELWIRLNNNAEAQPFRERTPTFAGLAAAKQLFLRFHWMNVRNLKNDAISSQCRTASAGFCASHLPRRGILAPRSNPLPVAGGSLSRLPALLSLFLLLSNVCTESDIFFFLPLSCALGFYLLYPCDLY